MARANELAALARALTLHRLRVVPAVRAQLAICDGAASVIPDPQLREAALRSLREKHRNVEAVGIFAVLAPPPHRRATIRAIGAFQIAVDYLDSLSEHPEAGLEDSLCLHGAILDAVKPDGDTGEWYRHHPRAEDGGYLEGLVAACRRELAALPAIAQVLPTLQVAARRCGEGQSHTHAAGTRSGGELRRWAESLGAPPDYLWWEVAAGASSSVSAHALLSAAADPATSRGRAERLDAAYFPSIGALTVLLDDLVDLEDDLQRSEHSYIGYYLDPDEAAERILCLDELASAALNRVGAPRLHQLILSGILAFYLSATGLRGSYQETVRTRILRESSVQLRAFARVLRTLQLGSSG